MTTSMLSPTRYLSGTGSLQCLGQAVAAHGKHALIIHGGVGIRLVEPVLHAQLDVAQVQATLARHEGPCELTAIARLVEVGRAAGCDVVIGVGGGRVLDVSKAVADALDAPFVLVPTSPATCAATSAVVVLYQKDGVNVGSNVVTDAAAYTVVDPALLASAPDRLLVAGLVDALAKVVEVRFASARTPGPSAANAAALNLCDELEHALFERAPGVVQAGPIPTPERQMLAEMCVLWPGLIGGLVGEKAKLAAAHAVHNALTLVPGIRRSLHGEILAFGILVQRVLAGHEGDEVQRYVDLFRALGCPADLTALGAEQFRTDAELRQQVLQRACAMASMRASFPDVTVAKLERAMHSADEFARSAGSLRAP